ncbi:MAG: hypothetical protein JNM28_06430 [Armatimonadetes bacterium]|nr:hypothetical protein [Armatimonadota bacterium]
MDKKHVVRAVIENLTPTGLIAHNGTGTMRLAIISAVIIAVIGLAMFVADVLTKQVAQHKKSIRDFS